MYCSLIKKFTVTNKENLLQLSFNKTINLISIVGTKGFVNLMDFNSFNEISLTNSIFRQSDVGSNLLLKHHQDDVIIVLWNEKKEKLTTCDKSGVIVIWGCNEGNWEQTMVNKRKKEFNITHINWSKQGDYVCFSYEDGYVILGHVNGDRKWGKSYEKNIYLIEFTPNEKNILLACENYNILIVDLNGTLIGEIEIEKSLLNVKIVTLSYYDYLWNENIDLNNQEYEYYDYEDASSDNNLNVRKNLMVVFQNSNFLFYHNEFDQNYKKIKIDELNYVIKAEWSILGDFFVVCGFLEKDNSKTIICFYNSQYEFMTYLLSPEPIIDFDFSFSTLYLLSDKKIYYGIIKQKFIWCFLIDTLVYATHSDDEYYTLIFWNTKLNEYNYKYVRNIIGICSFNNLCLITSKNEDDTFLLILSNSIGCAIDNKIINIKPLFYSINETHVVISDENYIYLWQFRGKEKKENEEGNEYSNLPLIFLNKKNQKEICFFIDDIPNINMEYNLDTFNPNKISKDVVSALTLSNDFLFVVCESGKGIRYNLLSLTSIDKYNFEKNINSIGMSPSSRYLWTINENNLLCLYDIEKDDKKYKGIKLNFEKKDIWAVEWHKVKSNERKEDELSFSFFEKNKLNVINNLKTEDIYLYDAYLAIYSNMTITLVKLEQIMSKHWKTKHNANEVIIKLESKMLKEFNDLMKGDETNLEDLLKYVEEHPNEKLWKELAKYSLENLNFDIAEKCFIQTNDYNGLQLIKKLKNIEDDNLKKAEIAQYFNNYEEAEEILKKNDRQDLIVDMNMKLGKWDKVIDIMKENGINENDENMKISLLNQGNQFLEKKDYDNAEKCYKKTGNIKGLANVYFGKEDYENASKLIDEIKEGDDLLNEMGEKFETYGLLDEAVKCYLKNNNVGNAINSCIKLNRWDKAFEIAEKYNYYEFDELIKNFSDELIQKGKKMDLIDLFRKSHRHINAAKIINSIAEDFQLLKMNPLTMKKIYVFYALEMEYYNTITDNHISKKFDKNNIQVKETFDNLINTDLSNLTRKILNNYWSGAEAYHYYMLCQVFLYKKNYKNALKCALRLVLYEKYLGIKNVYSLIALSAFLNKSYKYCSKAISKLENLKDLKPRIRNCYKELAVKIFIRNDCENIDERFLKCPNKNCENEISEYALNCEECGNIFSACVITGQSIFTKDYFKCKRCKHKSLKSEIYGKKIKHCPMCHVFLGPKKSN